ncbi:MAG: penicillin-binding transpeptidase domain-containing protein, partial [Stackebrandtia sp.]
EDGDVLEQSDSDVWKRPISESTAAAMQQLMEASAEYGYASAAQIDGLTVGGKTGTAETGDDPEHGWFTGYAFDDDGEPAVAVTVFLANSGDGGSSEAAKIAGDLMKLALDK